MMFKSSVSELSWFQEKSIWMQYYQKKSTSFVYEDFLNFIQKYSKQVEFELKGIKYLVKEDTRTSIQRWYAFQFLCLAGGLVSFCNGFNGMTSVLQTLFPNMVLGVLISLGIVAALSALSIFIAQDKPALLENFQIYPEVYFCLADEYLFYIQIYLHHHQQSGQKILLLELPKYYALRTLLKSKKNYNQKILDTMFVTFQSHLIIGIGAILYFSDSFFVGQSMMSLLGQFYFSESFLFSLTFSICLGFLGLIYYWGRERPSLEQFLQGEWFTDNHYTEERLSQLQADIHELEFGLRCSG